MPSTFPNDPELAAASVPGGRWGVAVSGGGDSIALLELLRIRGDLTLHIIHLDHETRAGESAQDAQFVRDRAAACCLALTLARRSEIEPGIHPLPRNLSARYRAIRIELYRRVVREHSLDGVLLAHHADDQAETIFQRLLRGSGPHGLVGMSSQTTVGGVTLLRPMLGVSRAALRQWLIERGITWREDSSNRSPLQQRNRARMILSAHPRLSPALVELSSACAALVGWLRDQSPEMGDDFSIDAIVRLSPPIAREALRCWLARHAGAGIDISQHATRRLLAMATDRATPPRQHFPGGLLVCRRGSRIFIEHHGEVVAGRVDAASASASEIA